MNTYTIFAKNPDKIAELREIAAKLGFQYDPSHAQFMITIGGDGTFLLAEHRYPGLPKLMVRDSLVCFKCHNEPVAAMLHLIREGMAQIFQIEKLQAVSTTATILAANDIVIRNIDPRHALRFRLAVDGKPIDGVLIGDGAVIATSFGSTGYFHSITCRTFSSGLGLAFNNPTVARSPLVLGSEAVIEVRIVRGEAHLTADNHSELLILRPEDSVTIALTGQRGRIIGHE